MERALFIFLKHCFYTLYVFVSLNCSLTFIVNYHSQFHHPGYAPGAGS